MTDGGCRYLEGDVRIVPLETARWTIWGWEVGRGKWEWGLTDAKSPETNAVPGLEVQRLPAPLVHPAHPATTAGGRRVTRLLLALRHDALGREEKPGDRCRALQRG